MRKVILVPTSHIAEQSIREARKVIKEEKPDCVAVELDTDRYYSIKAEKSATNMELLKGLGFSTFLMYFVMKKIQTFLGNKVGILPGMDMVNAVDIASEKMIMVAFIDRDIRLTFLKLKDIPRREKFKLIWFVLKGIVAGPVLSKLGSKTYSIDLSKVPEKEIVNEAMAVMKSEFPYMYKVLVSERDRIMTGKLRELSKHHGKVVAFVGAGHYPGMKKLLV
jgi:pheromone shutdown protein TraB